MFSLRENPLQYQHSSHNFIKLYPLMRLQCYFKPLSFSILSDFKPNTVPFWILQPETILINNSLPKQNMVMAPTVRRAWMTRRECARKNLCSNYHTGGIWLPADVTEVLTACSCARVGMRSRRHKQNSENVVFLYLF